MSTFSGTAGIVRLHWSRYKFPESLYTYGAWIVVLSFLAFSIEYLEIPLGRIPDMTVSDADERVLAIVSSALIAAGGIEHRGAEE